MAVNIGFVVIYEKNFQQSVEAVRVTAVDKNLILHFKICFPEEVGNYSLAHFTISYILVPI